MSIITSVQSKTNDPYSSFGLKRGSGDKMIKLET